MQFRQCPKCGALYGPFGYMGKGGFRELSPFACGGHTREAIGESQKRARAEILKTLREHKRMNDKKGGKITRGAV